MFKFLEPQKSIDDIKLIAWHHMINDPFLTTYEFINGHEYRSWVNPKLAYRRSMATLSKNIIDMADKIMTTFLPSFEEMSAAFQRFQDSLEQLILPSRLDPEDGVG